MSVQEPPQFTPSQVLEAGRRAESEGRGEYALQFYRHLVENYPGSGEASAAMSALTRLGVNPHASLTSRLAAQPAFPAATPAEPRFELSMSGPPKINPYEQGHSYQQPFQQPPGYAPAQQAPSPPQYAPGEVHADHALMVELPPRPRDYRTGRFLARMFSWLGILVTFLGMVVLVAAVLSPRLVTAIPLIGAWGSGAFTSIVLIFAGLFQLMLGQFVRAALDQSIAIRDLAAVTRAEAEARYGSPPGRSRRR